MKRFGALAAALLILGLLLAACGSDDDPGIEGGAGTTAPMGDEGTMANDDMGDDHDKSSDVAADARRIEVTATSFEFDPDEIRVDAGESIAIVLASEDILHDLTIDELDAHVAAARGETAEGGLIADEPGRYTYYCTVTGHREAGMEGTLVVE